MNGAVNASVSVSVLNPAVGQECVCVCMCVCVCVCLCVCVGQECQFCSLRETVFHVCMQSVRLRPLFFILQVLFVKFELLI